MVDSATIAPLDDPDEFRDGDLVGLSVRTVDGTVVGTVADVLHPARTSSSSRRRRGPAASRS